MGGTSHNVSVAPLLAPCLSRSVGKPFISRLQWLRLISVYLTMLATCASTCPSAQRDAGLHVLTSCTMPLRRLTRS